MTSEALRLAPVDLLCLPMGTGHAGCHVGGLGREVVERYADGTDGSGDLVSGEQRAAIAAWLRATDALGGRQAHTLAAELAAKTEYMREKGK